MNNFLYNKQFYHLNFFFNSIYYKNYIMIYIILKNLTFCVFT